MPSSCPPPRPSQGCTVPESSCQTPRHVAGLGTCQPVAVGLKEETTPHTSQAAFRAEHLPPQTCREEHGGLPTYQPIPPPLPHPPFPFSSISSRSWTTRRPLRTQHTHTHAHTQCSCSLLHDTHHFVASHMSATDTAEGPGARFSEFRVHATSLNRRGQVTYFSVPQFSHVQNGHNNGTSLSGGCER